MTDVRNAAQERLRAAVLELKDLRGCLLELAERLAPAEEAVVQCVILDRLDPAIRDLAGAVTAIGDEG
jgi:hypothetical protein